MNIGGEWVNLSLMNKCLLVNRNGDLMEIGNISGDIVEIEEICRQSS